MFSIIWILAIGWLLVAFVNSWQMRSMERHWENLLREHTAPPEQQCRSQRKIVDVQQ